MPALSSLCGGFGVIVGLLMLSGWAMGASTIASLLPGFPAAQPITALAMFLSGAALMLQAAKAASRRQVAVGIAVVVVFICLFTFLAYAGFDIGMDRWLFPSRLAAQPGGYEHPGRMAEVTAVGFLLVVLAIAAKALGRFLRLATAAATLSLVLAGATLLAYLFKARPLYEIAGFDLVSLPTAIAIAALSVGVLMAEPLGGWPRRLTLDTPGGRAARALLPWAIGLPIVTSGVALVGSRAGLYSPDFRLAGVGITSAVLLSAAVMLASKRIDAAEAARDADRAARVRAEERLLQAQKMAALGQMAGSVAHDFNNLLHGLRGAFKVLADPASDPDRRLRYLGAGEQSLAHAADLIHSLLAFARQQPIQKQIFEVTARVRAMEHVLRSTLASRLALKLEFSHTPAWVEAAPTQFDVALLNLVVNARDASDRHGQIMVRVEHVETPNPAASRPHSLIAVRVRDFGSGISLDALPHIFEPFYTTKDAGRGTGLGLAQVRTFAQENGGELTVESQPGEGSTFSILLPLVAKADATGTGDRKDGRHALTTVAV